MSVGHPGSVLGQIRSLFGGGSLAGLGERQLLERFVVDRDEAAFEALLARHGPMVLGVCRRALDDPGDVEDAFQATFLVLIRKAGGLRDGDRLANWLYGVAHRVATRARSDAHRRRSRERPGGEEVAVASEPVEDRIELRAVLDDELTRLPDRLRAAVVLCDLEGLPQEEAARRLGCPVGTIKSRLSRARDRLRGRLLRRGVAPSSLLAASFLDPARCSAAVPNSLQASTLLAATRFAAGAAAPAPAAALMESVARSMMMAKLKVATTAILALTLATAGALALTSRAVPGDPPAPASAPLPVPDLIASVAGPARTLNLTIIAKADRRPVPGAAVEVRLLDGYLTTAKRTTDADGRCPVPIPAKDLEGVLVGVSRDGFVPVSLDPGQLERDAVTLELEPGVAVGGVIRDEEGRPVAGARVIPSLFDDSPGSRRSFFSPEGGVATTDAEGRWRASILPADAEGALWVRFEHPDYVSDPPRSFSRNFPVAEARAFLGQMVLKRGIAVAGTVVGPEGRPVEGASVVLPLSTSVGDGFRATTDAEGRFRFAHVEDHSGVGEWRVIAEAAGFAPASVRVEAGPEPPPATIRLSPGRPFRGRVVDAQGQPLAGAVVSVAAWQECRNLDWRAETDTEGRFTWADAPTTGDISFVVRKAGYATTRGRDLAVSDPGPVITLNRPLVVRGLVVDAVTNRPVEAFEVVLGLTWPAGGGGGERHDSWWYG